MTTPLTQVRPAHELQTEDHTPVVIVGAGAGGLTAALALHRLGVECVVLERDAYGEGVRRGGFMLCAEVDSDEDADRIVAVLEQTSPVDMDQRQQDWRSEGWQQSSSPSGQMGRDSADFYHVSVEAMKVA